LSGSSEAGTTWVFIAQSHGEVGLLRKKICTVYAFDAIG